MNTFLVGMGLFFSIHFISIINDPWRNRMASRLGELPWKAFYGLVALVGLYLLVKGYGEARPIAELVYIPPGWTSHLAALLMLPVFPLLIATYLPGRINGWVRHPMLVATKFWAVAHLLTNGRTIDLLLFGSFLLWAILVRISYIRRNIRPVYGLPKNAINDWLAVILGLGLYAMFIKSWHGLLIGVYPLG